MAEFPVTGRQTGDKERFEYRLLLPIFLIDGRFRKNCFSRFRVFTFSRFRIFTFFAFFTFFTFSTDSAFPAVPLWFFVLVLGRDIVLGAGCLILQSRVGVAHLEHQFHGKATTVILLLVILLYTVNLESVWLDRAVLFASGIVVLSTLAYLSEGMAQLRKGTASGAS